MDTIGIDVGGANLKLCHSNGTARSEAFPIWRAPDELASRLAAIVASLPHATEFALTITAELADCFATKAKGVAHVVEQVRQVTSPSRLGVWSTAGGFLDCQEAIDRWQQVAAANWHALATLWGQSYVNQLVLMVDIGSTTTDIIPIVAGQPATVGLTDPLRLAASELVYTGATRTPLCAVLGSLEVNNQPCGVSAEFFATMRDVYLVLELIPEDPRDCDTADGRPATKEHAHARIARMICSDTTEVSRPLAVHLAQQVATAQTRLIVRSLQTVMGRFKGPIERVLLSGSGAFLWRQIAQETPQLGGIPVDRLAERLSPDVSTAACAWAVAQLANQRFRRLGD